MIREETCLNAENNSETSALATLKGLRKSNDKRIKKDKKTQKDKKDIECYKCHEYGHFARECKTEKRRKGERSNNQSGDCAFVVEGDASEAKCVQSARACESRKVARDVLAAGQVDAWITDSGASAYMTPRREWLTDYRENKNGDTVVLGDNEECDVVGQ